jgi:hypothetical protein
VASPRLADGACVFPPTGVDIRNRCDRIATNIVAAAFLLRSNHRMSTMATVERVALVRERHWSARTISILAALAVDAGLVWLLYFRAKYNPPVGEAEMFWLRALAGFGAYTILQQWTLASQTGHGDDFSAALDKFVAASPIVVAAVIEAYWLGAEGAGALTWRHHTVAGLWSAFALTDFFATDITNQRLKARQMNVGDGGA